MALSPDENPFTVIDGRFSDAYDPDSPYDAGVIFGGSEDNRIEMLLGQQENGWPLNLFRPAFDATGKDDEASVFTVFLQNPAPGTTSQFEVKGTEAHPSVIEILSREPFTTRDLTEAEMVDLARKIGRTTFH